MKNLLRRVWPVAKWLLIVWGFLSLVAIIALAGLFYYHSGPGNQPRTDEAGFEDIRHVLNWCDLGDDRFEKIIHSYVSARSFTGDHFDAFAIKINRLELEELTNPENPDVGPVWFRGDQLPQFLKDGVELVGDFSASQEAPWFPKTSELCTDQYYVYPWSVDYARTRPNSAEIIFVRPSDKMVFYASVKL